RSHPASLYVQAAPTTLFDPVRDDLGAVSLDLLIKGPGHSVRLNSRMATDIMTSPITATMPSENHNGTTQPPQVISGARWVFRMAATCGGTLRWLKTRCRIGPTT